MQPSSKYWKQSTFPAVNWREISNSLSRMVIPLIYEFVYLDPTLIAAAYVFINSLYA